MEGHFRYLLVRGGQNYGFVDAETLCSVLRINGKTCSFMGKSGHHILLLAFLRTMAKSAKLQDIFREKNENVG